MAHCDFSIWVILHIIELYVFIFIWIAHKLQDSLCNLLNGHPSYNLSIKMPGSPFT